MIYYLTLLLSQTILTFCKSYQTLNVVKGNKVMLVVTSLPFSFFEILKIGSISIPVYEAVFNGGGDKNYWVLVGVTLAFWIGNSVGSLLAIKMHK